MKKSELFEAFDLFDVRDFGKVRHRKTEKEMEAWLLPACVPSVPEIRTELVKCALTPTLVTYENYS